MENKTAPPVAQLRVHGVITSIKNRWRRAISREEKRTGKRIPQYRVFEEMVVWYEGEVDRRAGK